MFYIVIDNQSLSTGAQTGTISITTQQPANHQGERKVCKALKVELTVSTTWKIYQIRKTASLDFRTGILGIPQIAMTR